MSRKQLGLAAALAVLGFGCSSGSSGGGGDSLVTLSGPQTGTISVDLSNGEVSITKPQAIKLSAEATYDDPTDQLTISLTAQNYSTSTLHNAKVLVTTLSEGGVTGDGAFGAAAGDGEPVPPYIYFGPNSLAPKDEATGEIIVTGVTGVSADWSMDLELVFHPWFITGSAYDIAGEDASGSGQDFTLDTSELSFDDGRASFVPSALSSDGQKVYMGCRNQPAVAFLDLTTMTTTFSEDLTGGGSIAFDGTGSVGSVDGPTMSPDGNYLYAVLNLAHFYPGGTYPPGEITLLKLNADDLTIAESLVVFDPPTTEEAGVLADGAPVTEYRGRSLSVNGDGTRGALPIMRLGLVAYVDLENMVLIDTYPIDLGTPTGDGGGGGFTTTETRFAAISPDASMIAVAFSYSSGSDGTLALVSTTDGSITTITPPTAETFAGPGALQFGPDGRLYFGRNHLAATGAGLSIYNPATDTWIEQADVDGCAGIFFSSDGASYYVKDYGDGDLHAFDVETDAILTFEASGLDALTNTYSGNGHGLVVTR